MNVYSYYFYFNWSVCYYNISPQSNTSLVADADYFLASSNYFYTSWILLDIYFALESNNFLHYIFVYILFLMQLRFHLLLSPTEIIFELLLYFHRLHLYHLLSILWLNSLSSLILYFWFLCNLSLKWFILILLLRGLRGLVSGLRYRFLFKGLLRCLLIFKEY